MWPQQLHGSDAHTSTESCIKTLFDEAVDKRHDTRNELKMPEGGSTSLVVLLPVKSQGITVLHLLQASVSLPSKFHRFARVFIPKYLCEP